MLVGLSAEVVSEYAPLVRSLHPNSHVVPVSCIDAVFGYLPTERIAAEGGYEGGGCFPFFGLKGQFRPEVQRVVMDALRGLAPQPTPPITG